MLDGKRVPLSLKLAVILLVVSGILIPEILGALQTGYSPVINYLSELGAIGAPFATAANYFSFLPVAIAVIVISVMLASRLRGAGRMGVLLIGLGIIAGYLIAFLFRCDPGCPVEGSSRQNIHNLGGLVQYVLGCLGALLVFAGSPRAVGDGAQWILRLLAVCVAMGFALMLTPAATGFAGAAQRLSDFSMFAILIVFALSGVDARGSAAAAR